MQFSNSFLKLLLTFFISLIFSRLELSLACSFQDLNGVCHVLCGTQTGSAMFFAGLERGRITLMGLKLELTCSMLNSNGVWLTFCGTRTGSDFLSARLKLGLTWSLQDSNRVLLALCGNQTRDGSLCCAAQQCILLRTTLVHFSFYVCLDIIVTFKQKFRVKYVSSIIYRSNLFLITFFLSSNRLILHSDSMSSFWLLS